MVNGKHGFAVIGYGGMGSWHIRNVKEHFPDRAEIIGIYDIDPAARRRAEENGIKAFSSREELLADERIDLVTIATPNDVHKEIAIAALDAGKNVISEKPVTLSIPDYEEMVAAAKRNGKLFTTHQNRRWDPDYLIVRKLIDDNTLGSVFRIEHRVQGSRGVPGDWRNQKEHGGGMVLDWGVHLLDQMLQMTYPHKIVSVYNELTYVTNENCDDGFRATVIFDNGLSFYVEVTTSNFIELPLWYVLGENGTAVIRNWDNEGEVVKVSDWENRDAVPIQAGVGITKTMAPRTDETIKRYPLPEAQGKWEEYYANIFDTLEGKAQQIVTHDQQRRLLRLIDALFLSAKENRVVSFE